MNKPLSLRAIISTLMLTMVLTGCNKTITLNTGNIVITGNTTERNDTIQQGDTVEMTYVAMLPNGLLFKKTEADDVLSFVVGAGEVIKGLELGVIGMKVHEKKTREISPENGYASDYDPLKVKRIKKTLLEPGMAGIPVGAYIKIGNIEGTIKGFTQDENGAEWILVETNPLYTYTVLSYTVTIKKITANIRGTFNGISQVAAATPTVAQDATVREDRKNTPAEIKNRKNGEKGVTLISIDILSLNPNFLPGENDFFLNQSPKLRNFEIRNTTEAYKCGAGADGNDTIADVLYPLNTFLSDFQKHLADPNRGAVIYYFDIEQGIVTNVYEQCLP